MISVEYGWKTTSSIAMSERLQSLMTDHGIAGSMSRSGNVRDDAAMESFSYLKSGGQPAR